MPCPCRTVSIIAFVALLSAGPAFTQAPSTEESSRPAAAHPTAAYIYVQTKKGVNVYDATADGTLTLAKGSPFATTGQMGGINSKYLISVGTDYLHTYSVESNGAVGEQASEINSQDYAGAECGATGYNGSSNGAVLDHTGKYFYVQLFGAQYQQGNTTCAAWQSYQIASNGAFTFLGSTESTLGADGSAYRTTVPTISSNDGFGYPIVGEDCNCSYFVPLARTPSGELQANPSFTEVDPVGKPNTAWGYFPDSAKADPDGHLAVLMEVVEQYGDGNFVESQLASYTINEATGGISSTNTWKDMPSPQVYGSVMEMSPSGKLLALAGGQYSDVDGLQIFHFNGAAPITKYSALLLPAVEVDKLAWDNNNHLYALSYESNQLYVYTVTPTSISAAAGSPYSVQNSYGSNGLIVVPKR
ncbi:MAG: hypothetical protein ABSF53_03125 [Terracidiphilus sp.]|jgi:hypothetical protein